MPDRIYIGCAGWAIPKLHAPSFPPDGSHLERYAQRFNAVEINSSFYRPHRRTTYERWAATVPPGFSFAVKVPKEITHRLRLAGADSALDAFVEQATGLGDKLGPLLLQLPPSLAFEPQRTRAFLTALRARFDGRVVCEPRHRDWFAAPAEDVLREYRIGRVVADPPIVPVDAGSGGWDGLVYLRLHGSPRIYYSEYGPERLARTAGQIAKASAAGCVTWCIFDNTAAGAATGNALALRDLLNAR